MLFILSSFILAVVLLSAFCYFEDNGHDISSMFSCFFGLVSLAVFIISLACCIFSNINNEAYVAQCKQTYSSLVYQLENIDTLYSDSRANDKKELYNQIQEWNEDLASGIVKHDNPWTNWFYPADYSQFEFIELK